MTFHRSNLLNQQLRWLVECPKTTMTPALSPVPASQKDFEKFQFLFAFLAVIVTLLTMVLFYVVNTLPSFLNRDDGDEQPRPLRRQRRPAGSGFVGSGGDPPEELCTPDPHDPLENQENIPPVTGEVLGTESVLTRIAAYFSDFIATITCGMFGMFMEERETTRLEQARAQPVAGMLRSLHEMGVRIDTGDTRHMSSVSQGRNPPLGGQWRREGESIDEWYERMYAQGDRAEHQQLRNGGAVGRVCCPVHPHRTLQEDTCFGSVRTSRARQPLQEISPRNQVRTNPRMNNSPRVNYTEQPSHIGSDPDALRRYQSRQRQRLPNSARSVRGRSILRENRCPAPSSDRDDVEGNRMTEQAEAETSANRVVTRMFGVSIPDLSGVVGETGEVQLPRGHWVHQPGRLNFPPRGQGDADTERRREQAEFDASPEGITGEIGRILNRELSGSQGESRATQTPREIRQSPPNFQSRQELRRDGPPPAYSTTSGAATPVVFERLVREQPPIYEDRENYPRVDPTFQPREPQLAITDGREGMLETAYGLGDRFNARPHGLFHSTPESLRRERERMIEDLQPVMEELGRRFPFINSRMFPTTLPTRYFRPGDQPRPGGRGQVDFRILNEGMLEQLVEFRPRMSGNFRTDGVRTVYETREGMPGDLPYFVNTTLVRHDPPVPLAGEASAENCNFLRRRTLTISRDAINWEQRFNFHIEWVIIQRDREGKCLSMSRRVGMPPPRLSTPRGGCGHDGGTVRVLHVPEDFQTGSFWLRLLGGFPEGRKMIFFQEVDAMRGNFCGCAVCRDRWKNWRLQFRNENGPSGNSNEQGNPPPPAFENVMPRPRDANPYRRGTGTTALGVEPNTEIVRFAESVRPRHAGPVARAPQVNVNCNRGRFIGPLAIDAIPGTRSEEGNDPPQGLRRPYATSFLSAVQATLSDLPYAASPRGREVEWGTLIYNAEGRIIQSMLKDFPRYALPVEGGCTFLGGLVHILWAPEHFISTRMDFDYKRAVGPTDADITRWLQRPTLLFLREVTAGPRPVCACQTCRGSDEFARIARRDRDTQILVLGRVRQSISLPGQRVEEQAEDVASESESSEDSDSEAEESEHCETGITVGEPATQGEVKMIPVPVQHQREWKVDAAPGEYYSEVLVDGEHAHPFYPPLPIPYVEAVRERQPRDREIMWVTAYYTRFCERVQIDCWGRSAAPYAFRTSDESCSSQGGSVLPLWYPEDFQPGSIYEDNLGGKILHGRKLIYYQEVTWTTPHYCACGFCKIEPNYFKMGKPLDNPREYRHGRPIFMDRANPPQQVPDDENLGEYPLPDQEGGPPAYPPVPPPLRGGAERQASPQLELPQEDFENMVTPMSYWEAHNGWRPTVRQRTEWHLIKYLPDGEVLVWEHQVLPSPVYSVPGGCERFGGTVHAIPSPEGFQREAVPELDYMIVDPPVSTLVYLQFLYVGPHRRCACPSCRVIWRQGPDWFGGEDFGEPPRRRRRLNSNNSDDEGPSGGNPGPGRAHAGNQAVSPPWSPGPVEQMEPGEISLVQSYWAAHNGDMLQTTRRMEWHRKIYSMEGKLVSWETETAPCFAHPVPHGCGRSGGTVRIFWSPEEISQESEFQEFCGRLAPPDSILYVQSVFEGVQHTCACDTCRARIPPEWEIAKTMLDLHSGDGASGSSGPHPPIEEIAGMEIGPPATRGIVMGSLPPEDPDEDQNQEMETKSEPPSSGESESSPQGSSGETLSTYISTPGEEEDLPFTPKGLLGPVDVPAMVQSSVAWSDLMRAYFLGKRPVWCLTLTYELGSGLREFRKIEITQEVLYSAIKCAAIGGSVRILRYPEDRQVDLYSARLIEDTLKGKALIYVWEVPRITGGCTCVLCQADPSPLPGGNNCSTEPPRKRMRMENQAELDCYPKSLPFQNTQEEYYQFPRSGTRTVEWITVVYNQEKEIISRDRGSYSKQVTPMPQGCQRAGGTVIIALAPEHFSAGSEFLTLVGHCPLQPKFVYIRQVISLAEARCACPICRATDFYLMLSLNRTRLRIKKFCRENPLIVSSAASPEEAITGMSMVREGTTLRDVMEAEKQRTQGATSLVPRDGMVTGWEEGRSSLPNNRAVQESTELRTHWSSEGTLESGSMPTGGTFLTEADVTDVLRNTPITIPAEGNLSEESIEFVTEDREGSPFSFMEEVHSGKLRMSHVSELPAVLSYYEAAVDQVWAGKVQKRDIVWFTVTYNLDGTINSRDIGVDSTLKVEIAVGCHRNGGTIQVVWAPEHFFPGSHVGHLVGRKLTRPYRVYIREVCEQMSVQCACLVCRSSMAFRIQIQPASPQPTFMEQDFPPLGKYVARRDTAIVGGTPAGEREGLVPPVSPTVSQLKEIGPVSNGGKLQRLELREVDQILEGESRSRHQLSAEGHGQISSSNVSLDTEDSDSNNFAYEWPIQPLAPAKAYAEIYRCPDPTRDFVTMTKGVTGETTKVEVTRGDLPKPVFSYLRGCEYIGGAVYPMCVPEDEDLVRVCFDRKSSFLFGQVLPETARKFIYFRTVTDEENPRCACKVCFIQFKKDQEGKADKPPIIHSTEQLAKGPITLGYFNPALLRGGFKFNRTTPWVTIWRDEEGWGLTTEVRLGIPPPDVATHPNGCNRKGGTVQLMLVPRGCNLHKVVHPPGKIAYPEGHPMDSQKIIVRSVLEGRYPECACLKCSQAREMDAELYGKAKIPSNQEDAITQTKMGLSVSESLPVLNSSLEDDQVNPRHIEMVTVVYDPEGKKIVAVERRWGEAPPPVKVSSLQCSSLGGVMPFCQAPDDFTENSRWLKILGEFPTSRRQVFVREIRSAEEACACEKCRGSLMDLSGGAPPHSAQAMEVPRSLSLETFDPPPILDIIDEGELDAIVREIRMPMVYYFMEVDKAARTAKNQLQRSQRLHEIASRGPKLRVEFRKSLEKIAVSLWQAFVAQGTCQRPIIGSRITGELPDPVAQAEEGKDRPSTPVAELQPVKDNIAWYQRSPDLSEGTWSAGRSGKVDSSGSSSSSSDGRQTVISPIAQDGETVGEDSSPEGPSNHQEENLVEGCHEFLKEQNHQSSEMTEDGSA